MIHDTTIKKNTGVRRRNIEHLLLPIFNEKKKNISSRIFFYYAMKVSVHLTSRNFGVGIKLGGSLDDFLDNFGNKSIYAEISCFKTLHD